MNLKDLTENKYTLNDIFTKKYEYWLAAPLFIYLLTPIIHTIVYSFTFQDDIDEAGIMHLLGTGENPGDYYVAIIKYSFLIGAVIALIGYIALTNAVREKTRKVNKVDWIPFIFLVVYMILIIVSSVVNKIRFNEYVLGMSNRAEGVISVFCYFLVFYLCGSFIRKEKIKKAAIWLFLYTSVAIGILTLINQYFTDLTFIGDNGVCAIFYHFNFYAYYLTMAVMLSASLTVLGKNRSEKIFAFIVMAFNIVMLAINDSFGGFLACSVAFVFLIVAASIKNKKVSKMAIVDLLVFLGIIFVVGLFTPSFFSEVTRFGSDVARIVEDSENAGDAGTARWTLWVHTVKYIKQKPWIGWGYEGTCGMLGTETHADRTHNEYLENMAFYGIPAGVIYVLGLVSVYVKALFRRKNVDNVTLCCLVGALGYIGSAFVGNSFIYVAPFCFIFLGLANNTMEKEVLVIETSDTETPGEDETPEDNEEEEIAEIEVEKEPEDSTDTETAEESVQQENVTTE